MNLHIKTLKRDAATGMVKSIIWIANLGNDQVRVETRGEQILIPKDSGDPTFVPYSNITLDIALDWLKFSLGQSGLDAIKGDLEVELQSKTIPAVLQGNPWDVEELPIATTPVEAPLIQRRTRFPIGKVE